MHVFLTNQFQLGLSLKGRQTVRYLVAHGANLEYVDLALRNALYWSLYNSCGETACYLLKAGIRVLPWTWMADESLPKSVTEDTEKLEFIRRVRCSPRSLRTLSR